MMEEEDISIYDEIEIEDMTFDETQMLYHYPCPCGDRFQIALEDLHDELDIAVCPSCSLMIRVIFDLVSDYIENRNAASNYAQSDLPSLPPAGTGGGQVSIAA
ncbi:hypothetical protein CP533_3180 [Ophiocordyceps camponoti-saundersi (nom. inval.)]|nr:hypothetical protein CP533_3180 [Ophiocordyceps camponoti-saundersi (nom. inval.)]